ncbi:hypothetical protein GCM10022252_75510 [Streptosporangium oxazolinicum]|uniref:IPT/TIG domain-containing protein n=1 Tax=Streptosporangium oxazolinicum TaxID=909287 RepID=A0ABP8BKR7_9ACTN
MTIYRAGKVQANKTTVNTLVTEVPVTDPLVQVSEHLWESVPGAGMPFPYTRRRLKFRAGQIVRRSEIDECFPAPTIDTVSPATGGTGGNTLVTLKGTNFQPGLAVTFGGTTATSITVISETLATCRTPAKTAGAVAVAVTNDGSTATKNNGFTYA